MNERTVVAWDGTEGSNAAFRWALERARRSNSTLTVVRVINDTTVSSDYLTTASSVERAKRDLDAMVDRVRVGDGPVSIDPVLVRGDPGERIRRFSGADTLLVVGARGAWESSRAHRWSIGSKLAANIDGPIAIIPRPTRSRASGVIVGVDGSAASEAAIRFATGEAALFSQPLTAVHAWDAPPIWQDAYVPNEALFQSLEESHESLLDEATREAITLNPDLEIRKKLFRGAAPRVLVLAARDASLLVVGNHGYRGLKRFVLGSVSHTVVLNIETPTIVVRERGTR